MIAPTTEPWLHQRGIAFILVLITVAIASVLAVAFLRSNRTTGPISTHLVRRDKARAVAESGMSMAISEARNNANWRTYFSNGTWVLKKPYGGVSFAINGRYGAGIGRKSTDRDGHSTRGNDDWLTLTVVGAFEGVTHTARAMVESSARVALPTVYMVVLDPAMLTTAETSRNALLNDRARIVAMWIKLPAFGSLAEALEAPPYEGVSFLRTTTRVICST